MRPRPGGSQLTADPPRAWSFTVTIEDPSETLSDPDALRRVGCGDTATTVSGCLRAITFLREAGSAAEAIALVIGQLERLPNVRVVGVDCTLHDATV